jgi:hypothetical protein
MNLVRGIILGAVGLGAFAVTACRDSGAERRADVQATLDQASRALRQASVTIPEPGTDAFAAREQSLNGVLGMLASVRDADAGQQAALGILVASANRELGAMHLAGIESVEADHRRARGRFAAMLLGAMRLESIAAARQAGDADAVHATLGERRVAAASGAREAESRLQKASEPIDQLESDNAGGRQDIERLASEAERLARLAAERGHAAGFASLEESVTTRRRAEQTRHQIDLRELDLRYQLEPERDLARSRVEYFQSLMTSLEAASAGLATFAAQNDAQADAVRANARELAGQIAQAVGELDASASGDLSRLYDQAGLELDRAAAAASRAASQLERDLTGTGRMTAARIQQLQGRLHATRAAGLASHALLLEHLAAQPESWRAGRDYPAALAAAEAARGQALDSARTAYAAAQENLNQITQRGSAAELTAFKSELEQTVRLLTGQPGEPPAAGDVQTAPGDSDSPGTPAPSSAAGDAPGFASPEEAVGFLNDPAPDNLAAAVRVVNSYRAMTPAAAQMIASWKKLVGPSEDLRLALTERFGPQVAASLGSMQSQFAAPSYSSAALADRTDSTASITVTTSDGRSDTLPLVRDGDRWFFDGDAAVAAIGPQELQAMQAMSSLIDAMAATMTDLARQIRAGELASPADVTRRLMESMMSSMDDAGLPTGTVPQK